MNLPCICSRLFLRIGTECSTHTCDIGVPLLTGSVALQSSVSPASWPTDKKAKQIFTKTKNKIILILLQNIILLTTKEFA